MVTFGGTHFTSGDYATPMDRGYFDNSPSPSNDSTNDVGVGIKDVGMSMGLGPVPNVQAVSAKMRAGSKTAELGFMGSGKGSAQGHTPGMYGEMQRQALREMQTANKFDFTTHASVGVYGLAGMDQQGNFSKQNKEMAVNEIKRAIDFAADVSRGGPVVVHTGEFQRPVSDASWNEDKRFKMYSDEEEMASYKVVDSRTGGVIQEARKNRKVARPIWNTAQKGMEYVEEGETKVASSNKDENGRLIYMDYFGNRIKDEERVPEYDSKEGKFRVHQMDWSDLQKEAKQMTLRAKEEYNDWVHAGRPDLDKLPDDNKFKKSYWMKFLKPGVSKDDIDVRPEEAYIVSTLETNAANSRGWGHYYGGQFDDYIDKIKKLEVALETYQKIEAETDDKEKWRLKQQAQALARGLVPEDAEMPTDVIEKELSHYRRQMNQSQEASASQWAQAEESMETIRHVQSAENYALGESFDAYAKAGMNAWEHTRQLEKQGKLKKPIAVAMENLFPESYGSHPDELMTLVEGGRKKMQEELMQRGMNAKEAEHKAQQHLVATFDTGHLNMWRKYWQGDPNKTLGENDKAFDKWMLDKVEELAKKKIVGHLHLVDNYGYQDDHLAPGEGNTPVMDIVKIFKKHGYKGEMIVEPGADYTTDVSGFHSVMKTWKLFGSSIYGASGAAPKAQWGNVQYGSFGQTQPPYFTFGGYSPSEDWTLWSGVPFE
jgi:hypothetical protein